MPSVLDRPTFVGGAGRSGTTLLRVCLDAHPALRSGPELKLLPKLAELRASFVGVLAPVVEAHNGGPDHVDRACRAFVETLLADFLAPGERWVEKTPHNVAFMADLGAIFPDARFVHVVRDGRDVVESLLRQQWADERGGVRQETTSARAAAAYWQGVVRTAQAQEAAPHLAGRVAEIRYEALVAEPEAMLRAVCEFLDVPWDDAVLHPERVAGRRAHEPMEASTLAVQSAIGDGTVGRWRTGLSAEQVADVEEVAGELLAELGYR